jgi:hypothetical protein
MNLRLETGMRESTEMIAPCASDPPSGRMCADDCVDADATPLAGSSLGSELEHGRVHPARRARSGSAGFGRRSERCGPASACAMVPAPGVRRSRSDRSAGEGENDVRQFVSITAAVILLCAGSAAAKADYARATREHRTFRAGFPPGWPSVCPRGYYARCSPFRCWCVIT